MPTLDELVNIDGVAVAAEWSVDGTLQDYKANMDISDEMLGRWLSSAPRSLRCSTLWLLR
jgi:roadblock/LC7 domain-containing protein